MGTIIGLIFVAIILGVVWWAVSTKLWPLIAGYVSEPFRTFIYVLMVFLFVFVVLWMVAQLLGLGGVHVPFFGSLGFR